MYGRTTTLGRIFAVVAFGIIMKTMSTISENSMKHPYHPSKYQNAYKRKSTAGNRTKLISGDGVAALLRKRIWKSISQNGKGNVIDYSVNFADNVIQMNFIIKARKSLSYYHDGIKKKARVNLCPYLRKANNVHRIELSLVQQNGSDALNIKLGKRECLFGS